MPQLRGPENPNWKGGFVINKGYVRLHVPRWNTELMEHSGGSKFILEHRYVMQKHIGRRLSRQETIHHINGNTLDNRIENLQILDKVEHTRLHWETGELREAHIPKRNASCHPDRPHYAKELCNPCYQIKFMVQKIDPVKRKEALKKYNEKNRDLINERRKLSRKKSKSPPSG